MKPLPLPLRVAAGLAVTTAERVRELPQHITGLPVTVVSQVLQLSMRVQQHVAELAIKGDDALSVLRPVEDTPSWATFDEDLESERSPSATSGRVGPPLDAPTMAVARPESPPETNGHQRGFADIAEDTTGDVPGDPWAQEEHALAQDHQDGEFDSVVNRPAGLSNYDALTLPQLRARLRRFSLEQLDELLSYETDHARRASFVGMLSRRIANVSKVVRDKATQLDSDGPAGR